MKVYLNAGHDRDLDPGAVNRRLHLRECDAAYELALGVQQYLERNGIAVVFGQDDDLYHICDQANQPNVTSLYPFTLMPTTAGPVVRKRSFPGPQAASCWDTASSLT